MNCYNGEKYLKEAIDSVYAQTFKDWEIIFIDNCSTDNSKNIVDSYDEKIKYFKTEKNIPLGAARNFGLQLCDGEYISFLDTDDIWFNYTLEKQLNTIKSGNYALVYGSQQNINRYGELINEDIVEYKEGNIFGKLLLQFDIPIVTTMIDYKKLRDKNLNFDINIYGSEEYCLFMQFSISENFKVITEPIVQYRILDNSLTAKTLSKRADDRIYTLNKIVETNNKIKNKYINEFKEAYARADYYRVQYLMSMNEISKARQLLFKHIFLNKTYFILNILLYLPLNIWNYVQNKKYKRI